MTEALRQRFALFCDTIYEGRKPAEISGSEIITYSSYEEAERELEGWIEQDADCDLYVQSVAVWKNGDVAEVRDEDDMPRAPHYTFRNGDIGIIGDRPRFLA